MQPPGNFSPMQYVAEFLANQYFHGWKSIVTALLTHSYSNIIQRLSVIIGGCPPAPSIVSATGYGNLEIKHFTKLK